MAWRQWKYSDVETSSRHGTLSGYYADGCRCEQCREFAADYAKRQRARRKAEFADGSREIEHGTLAGYASYGCRCERCKVAAAEYAKQLRARRLAEVADGTREIEHGTLAAYSNDGCRCDQCKVFATEHASRLRARRLAEVADGTREIEHGTLGGYTNDGCRCDQCKAASSVYQRSRNYGISRTQYDELLTAQHGTCAACGQVPANQRGFHVDHDHETGAVRGLLCMGCNVALGHLGDSVDRILALLLYLESAKGEAPD